MIDKRHSRKLLTDVLSIVVLVVFVGGGLTLLLMSSSIQAPAVPPTPVATDGSPAGGEEAETPARASPPATTVALVSAATPTAEPPLPAAISEKVKPAAVLSRPVKPTTAPLVIQATPTMRPPTVAPATSIARIGEDSTLPTRSPLALPATPTAPVVVSDPLAATPLSEPIVTPTVPIVADDPLTSTDELVPPAFPANELNVLLEHTGGTFGVVVYDLSSEVQVYARNETLSFSAASLIKVPIALTIHRLAEQGQLDLHTTLELRAEDIVGGTGVLQYREIGTTYSIEELVFLMLAESDNTATNMLLEHIGGFEVVNRLMDEVGATQTRMQRLMMDLDAIQQGRDNLTSPADMSLMLQLLSQDTVVNGASAQKIRAALQQTSDQQKIPANLPAGTIVMHKIGSLPNVEHDAGIVTTPQGRRYIVVFMSAQLPGNQAGIATIAQASRLIFDYESRLDP